MRPLVVAVVLVALLPAQERTAPAAQPDELGAVSWHRDFGTAARQAKDRDRPLLVLFQEVPG